MSVEGSCSADNVMELPPQLPWFSGELVAWDRSPVEHTRLAKALGYNCFADGRLGISRQYAADMNFYLNDPHKNVQPNMGFELTETELTAARAAYPFTFSHWPELPRAIDESELSQMKTDNPAMFERLKAAFERTKCWNNTTEPFPGNLAQLEKWAGTDRWEPCSDFQQEAVIDAEIASIVNYVKAREIPEINCLFEGISIDVIEIWREFNWNSDRKLPGSAETERYGLLHDGITHEYSTLREGWYVFLGRLRDELETELGRRIYYIFEPTPVSTWSEPLLNCTYSSMTPELFSKIKGDALVEEQVYFDYLTDENLYLPGRWTPYTVGTTSGDLLTKDPYYPLQLKYMGEITVRGGNFFSYGTFDRSTNAVSSHANQFKLIRALSTWEMMNRTLLKDRQWDNNRRIYLSPAVYADEHALAGLHPKNKKLYAVLLDAEAVLPLAPGMGITGIQTANEFFEPAGTSEAVVIDDGRIKPAPDADFPVSVIVDLSKTNSPVFRCPENLQRITRLTEENLYDKVLFNPDFEEGTAAWQAAGTAKIESIDQPVQSGSRALSVYNRSKTADSVAQRIDGFLMGSGPGEYRVTAWVCPQNNAADFRIGISLSENSVYRNISGTAVRAEAGEWTLISADLNVRWDSEYISHAKLYFKSSDPKDAYYIDNVTINNKGN
ncbi:MAG: carbohydrate binding domain-containing protein [Kiritimatiellales bacterium]